MEYEVVNLSPKGAYKEFRCKGESSIMAIE
jgi:hypothetical protein